MGKWDLEVEKQRFLCLCGGGRLGIGWYHLYKEKQQPLDVLFMEVLNKTCLNCHSVIKFKNKCSRDVFHVFAEVHPTRIKEDHSQAGTRIR